MMLFPENFYYDTGLMKSPNMSVNADKESRVYVIDRDNMRENGTSPNSVEVFGPTPPLPTNGSDPTQGYWNSPAYWKYFDSSGTAHYLLYYSASDGNGQGNAAPIPLYQYILATIGSTGPISASQQGTDYNTTTALFCRYSPTPSVSSTNDTGAQGDGAVAGTGILWAIETHRNSDNMPGAQAPDCKGAGQGSGLHAFDATTMEELYNSANYLSPGQLFDAHFNVPMVFQGRVYMGAAGDGEGNQIYVFGLCSEGLNGTCPPQ